MKVKINTHGNALPEVHGEWIDLCTAEDVTLDFLEYKIISLGVSIEIPAGYYAHVVPRSSTFGKWGILLAKRMGRGFVGCEINPSYVAMAAGRIAEVK